MSELVPFEPGDDRSYEEQIREALEHALTIQGTVINDLESAINCIIQMERGMKMCGVPNPHEATASYLKNKYNMDRSRTDQHAQESRRLLERAQGELVEGKPELVESIDGEIVEE